MVIVENEKEIEGFINQHKDTLITLKAFRDLNLISRTFMLNEHTKMIPELKNGTHEYKDTPLSMRTFLLSRVYLELFERLCLSIEDLTTMLYALQNDLKDFNTNITNPPKPENILKKLSKERWHKILHYSDLDEHDYLPFERETVANIRDENLKSLEALIECIIQFIEVYWVSFNKLKHGNTLVYGVEQTNIDGVETIIVPVIYNSKNKDKQLVLVLTDDIYVSWQKLFNTIIKLNKSLMEIAIQHIECGGLKFILNEDLYFPISKERRSEIENILKKYFNSPIRYAVNAQMKIAISNSTWEKHFELQKKIHTTLW